MTGAGQPGRVVVDPAATATVADVARRWVPAFLAGRRAPADVYAEHVVTWHAATGTETVVDGAPSQERLRALVPDLAHEDVRVDVHATGFVVRATVVGTVHGAVVRVPTALFVTVGEGRITRFEEYADSRSAAPFARLLTG